MPIRETGTAANGISVARQFWRNRNTTTNTSAIASTSVFTTSRIETFTKRVVSYTFAYVRPSGKRFARSAMTALHCSATSSALAPGWRNTPTSVACLPFTRPTNS